MIHIKADSFLVLDTELDTKTRNKIAEVVDSILKEKNIPFEYSGFSLCIDYALEDLNEQEVA